MTLFVSARGLPVAVGNSLQTENAQLVSLAIPQAGGQFKPVEEIPAAVETSKGDWMVRSQGKGRLALLRREVRVSIGVSCRRGTPRPQSPGRCRDVDRGEQDRADRRPPDGKILRKIGPKGNGYTLENPVDLAFDVFGHLYVLDREKATVFVFAHDGKLAASFTIAEKSPGAFQRATAIALDSAARLYIFDERTQHVQIYQ